MRIRDCDLYWSLPPEGSHAPVPWFYMVFDRRLTAAASSSYKNEQKRLN